MSFLLKISRTRKDMTFAQRLRYIAIWWGIPIWLAELVGVSWRSWILVLLVALPVAAISSVLWAALWHIVSADKRI